MKFQKYFAFCFLTVGLLFSFGCSQNSNQTTTNTNSVIPANNNSQTEVSNTVPSIDSLNKTVYTAFIINTHDWANPELSIATLNKIIDLHEEYQTPVDIYLDDPVVQIYQEQAPDLIERLKTSPYVAVSYHLRPPYPYYWDFDWLDLDKMKNNDLATLLLNYEEHEIDLSTGQPTIEPGGYQLLKDLMGYPPYTAVVMGSRKVMPLLAEIYKDKGALFTLTHSGTTGWGEVQNGLWMRPESQEVKVYEPRGRKSGEDILTENLAQIGTNLPAFMNLKWHEDNFYTSGTPWGPVYWTDEKERGTLSPPYDLSQAMVGVKVKTQAEKDEQWTRYEECLSYVKNHPEIFTAINAKELTNMFEGK